MLDKLIKKKRDPVFYWFSGKGGVGKTSCSAATALKFAQEGKKTLIISVDPAHSLADSFNQKIGGEVVKLDKNLYAVEIDPAKAVEEYKEKFRLFSDKMEALKGFGLDDTFDVAGMMPGIDEIAAFDKFIQYMQNKEYDVIIFDTAPTGHALRFLSLPDVLDSWIGKLIKIRMKFSGIMGLFKKILPFGEEEDVEKMGADQLDAMKERIEQAKKILTDKKKTFYNLVLIPEAMSILESERTLQVLKGYKIPVNNIIVNQITPNNKCDFCEERRENQMKRLEEIKQKFKEYNILTVPQMKHEVHGRESLEKISKELYFGKSK